MDGMKLPPRGQFTWSGVFFSSLSFCSWAFFLVPPSLNPIFFSRNSYLLFQPTYLPLPTPPPICAPLPKASKSHRTWQGACGELGVWNIKRSSHSLKVSVFFLASKTMSTSCSLSFWVFLIVVTFKTKTMNCTHCLGYFFMLQALKPQRRVLRLSLWFFFLLFSLEDQDDKRSL
jgi:hypothetical protein